MARPASRLRLVGVLLSTMSLVLVGLAAVHTASAEAGNDDFTAAGSARQVYAVGLAAGAKVELLDKKGYVVQKRRANSLGGVLFRRVDPGRGYRVRAVSTGKTSAPLRVRTNKPRQWNPGIYDQEIPSEGYGYLTTRDGT